MVKAKDYGEPWSKDASDPYDACRQIDHSRHGHRVVIGPETECVCAVLGNSPCEADPEADSVADRILACVNTLAGVPDDQLSRVREVLKRDGMVKS